MATAARSPSETISSADNSCSTTSPTDNNAMKILKDFTSDLWKLGDRRNWPQLQKLLTHLSTIPVLDQQTDAMLRKIATRFDTSTDTLGDNCLFWLLDSGDNHILLGMLLEIGVDPDRPQSEAWRPSHNAAFWGRKKCLEVLADCRVDLKAVTQDGETPSEVALENNKIELFKSIDRKLNSPIPSLAQLCKDRKWYAVRNLARRNQITQHLELTEQCDGKTAIQWLQHHDHRDLEAEFRHRFVNILGNLSQHNNDDKDMGNKANCPPLMEPAMTEDELSLSRTLD